MRRIVVPALPGRVAPWRIVLLAGAYHDAEDFERAGFAAAVRARALPVDLEFVAPELAHLLDRRILETLVTEVVVPARAAGVRSLWLGGVSLGAFLALLTAESRPAALDGLCLFAPWLGNRRLGGEIARAGGLRAWRPAERPVDEEHRAWTFARSWPLPTLAVHLGYGASDRFVAGQTLLAQVLRVEDREVVPGGHEWPVWQRLWEGFLDRRVVPALASLP